MIDTHCHLDLITRKENELQVILDQCKKENITSLINVSVDVGSNFNNEKLAEKHEEIYFTVGLHPHEAGKCQKEDITLIEKLIGHGKCIGIGEIGIDLFHEKGDPHDQIKLFEQCLDMAKRHGKPVVIHSRESFREVFGILRKPVYTDLSCIFHCFSYGYEEAKMCVDQGYKISFAGNVTYKNARNIQDAVKRVPLESVFLETDAPFLAPIPVRGQKNFPYFINHIVRFISQLRKEDPDQVGAVIVDNVTSFFQDAMHTS